MPASLRLPAICSILCFFSLDAMHIQVKQEPLAQKATAVDMSKFNIATINAFVKQNFDASMVSNFAKSVDKMMHIQKHTQKHVSFVSGGACNNTEIGDIVTMMLDGADKAENASASGGMMSGMGGLGGMGGMGGMGGTGAPPADQDPKIAAACDSSKMMPMMQFDWDAIGGCIHASMSPVRETCSDCVVDTLHAMAGKTMLDMPSSCMGTCLAASAATGGPNPACQKCMASHMETMIECIGFDTKMFSAGGKAVSMTPLGGGASSVLPHWAVTFLLGAVTLGVALIF